MATILVALAVAVLQADSVFNSYEVFLAPTRIPGACVVTDASHFPNRSYAFRGREGAGTPFTLRDGRALELNDVAKPEWETSLVAEQPVTVGGQAGADSDGAVR